MSETSGVVKPNHIVRLMYRWILQFHDPQRSWEAVRSLKWFFGDYLHYKKIAQSEQLSMIDIYPQLHDRTKTTSVDTHYFYSNGWTMRRVLAHSPSNHVDIGSEAIFPNLLSAHLPVIFLDYRPLEVRIEGLTCLSANILTLPFSSHSLQSISCLHVAEHIGLGRYGDPLDPSGTRDSCRELARVLAADGNLFLSLPVGRPRVCFNAHRVHTPETIVQMFPDLQLIEFSAVDDDGCFVEHANLRSFGFKDYACGMFWFHKST